MITTLNLETKLLLRFLEDTFNPLFLTGKAGTGKTTLLHYIKSNSTKNTAIVAPTAVASINAGGVTINSFFQMPFGPLIPTRAVKPISLEKSKILKCLDLLIIDEISMVRADTLDYIDALLKQVRASARPFGGVQILFIGDLYQLPPVFHLDWPVLQQFYQSPYFFESKVLKTVSLITFELNTVHRQNDPLFIDILNGIREGNLAPVHLNKLNERYMPSLTGNSLNDYVTLSTHNQLVSDTNRIRLAELPGEISSYKATITGDFPKDASPAEDELDLKVGAQVMFIKNDTSGKKQYYNGRTARVTSLSKENISVTFLDDDTPFDVKEESWQNIKYSLAEEEKKVSETNAGTFTQFPIKLAWAITIHKSQGLTFNQAIIDIDAAFSSGQAYVALSRCRTLEGMVLKSPIRSSNIMTDPLIVSFMEAATRIKPDNDLLEKTKVEFELALIRDIFDYTAVTENWDILKSIIIAAVHSESQYKLTFQKIHANLVDIIKKTADNFIRQEIAVLPMDIAVWSHDPFIIRLKAATAYFFPKLKLLIESFDELLTTTSATDFPNEFYLSLNVLIPNVKAKAAAYMRAASATSCKDLLNAMREATQTYRPIAKNWSPGKTKEKEISNPELYHQLTAWRSALGIQRNVADYTLVSEKTLKEIAARTPRTLEQLALLKGIGDPKANDFGEQIIKLVRSFLGENELFS